MNWQEILERAQSTPPDPERLTSVVAAVLPNWSVTSVRRLRGGLGAVMHVVDLVDPGGAARALVLRGLMPEFGETADDLRREVATHGRLRAAGIRVPDVVWSDADGTMFDRPTFLMEFAEGDPLIGSMERADAPTVLARTLSAIHDVPVEPGSPTAVPPGRYLSDRRGVGSEIVDADAIRRRLEELAPHVTVDPAVTLHCDFHGGNVLWDGRVATVLDWTHAGTGSRWFDESYAHMDTLLAWGAGTADAFRTAYRAISGETSDDLRFWDLLAVRRALPSPEMWLPAFRASGCTDLTADRLVNRYVDLAEGLLGA